ncbi:MAG: SDR family oxidoreductase [Geminicoccaceae bacterium]|nr:MAG: SDR family oxidoreductase [Geminicoccaceae bacterium]
MYRLDGKVALVTGAGSGIGRAVALRLAEEGCAVGLLGRRRDPLEEVAEAIRARGQKAAIVTADVAVRPEVKPALDQLQTALGPADILVNNAGILRFAKVLETTPEDWHATLQTNADGTLWCCQAVVPGMVERGRGRVINMGSWLSKKAVPYYGAYAASKFAILALTQALALEVAGSGVTVNAICPGMIVDTAMRDESEAAAASLGLPPAAERLKAIPLQRPGYPEDVAKLAAFLASDESAYMTGQGLNVTGGLWLH